MRKVHVRPDKFDKDKSGNDKPPNGMPENAILLTEAAAAAQPGDALMLWPGRYHRPVTIRASGTAEAPIHLVAVSERRVIFDGGQAALIDRPDLYRPTLDNFAAFKLVTCAHVSISGVRFQNCWPTAIHIEDAHDIRVANCAGLGARFFVYARSSDHGLAHRILLERSDWIQDPDFDMWHGRAGWPEVKETGGFTNRGYFNGAMFGSHNATGPITIRDNSMSHAFNAIRMDIDPDFLDRDPDNPRIRRNRDVAIYRNRFAFIRDNAVEPERGAENWRVAGNSFFNVHAALSVDGVAMRDFIFIGNTMMNNRKPAQHGQEGRGGKIIKFLREKENTGEWKDVPRRDFWTLFNSVQTRTSYAKKGITTAWEDFGNAVGLWQQDYPLISAPRPLFTAMNWTGAVRVRALATDDPGYPDTYRKQGAWMSDFAPLARVFDLVDPGCEPKETLGGWNGALPLSGEAAALDCPGVALTGVDGITLDIRPGLSPGAHDLAMLVPKDWLERCFPDEFPQPAV